ncbi:MAG: ATP-binding protein [Sphingomonadaceae bacterium]
MKLARAWALLTGVGRCRPLTLLVAAGLLLPRLIGDRARRKSADVERARLQSQLRQRVAESQQLVAQLEQRMSERMLQLKTLYEVAAVVGGCLDVQVMLQRSLDRIVTALDSVAGAIQLRDPTYGRLSVVAPESASCKPLCTLAAPMGESLPFGECGRGEWGSEECRGTGSLSSDGRTRPAVRRAGGLAQVALPIRSKGQVVGTLCLFRPSDRPFSTDETALLTAVSEHIGGAVENLRLFAEAQDKATLAERHRLASELHDSVTQLTYSEMLLAEAARQMMTTGRITEALQYLERLGETAQQALKEMRLLLYELRPLGPAEEGLVVSLQRRLDAVERRSGMDARMHVEGTLELHSSVEEGLYRIAQEALNNALKHAQATSVEIGLRATHGVVEMTISDNGRGFDPSGADEGGLGLTTMRERAARLGGSISIHSTPGHGTIARVTVPLVQNHSWPLDDIGADSPVEASEVSR